MRAQPLVNIGYRPVLRRHGMAEYRANFVDVGLPGTGGHGRGTATTPFTNNAITTGAASPVFAVAFVHLNGRRTLRVDRGRISRVATAMLTFPLTCNRPWRFYHQFSHGRFDERTAGDRGEIDGNFGVKAPVCSPMLTRSCPYTVELSGRLNQCAARPIWMPTCPGLSPFRLTVRRRAVYTAARTNRRRCLLSISLAHYLTLAAAGMAVVPDRGGVFCRIKYPSRSP